MLLFLRYNKITIVFSFILIILCGFPGNKMPSMDIMDLLSFDKLAHMLCFGLLCFFAITGLVKYLHFSFMKRHSFTYGVAYSIFLGAATEIAQAFLAIHRSGDWIDFLADCLGITLGALVYLLIYREPRVG